MFKTRVKELRKNANLNGEKFGSIFGVTANAVSLWERGLNQPNNDILIKIADYFHVSTDYLLGRTDDPRPVSMHSLDDGEIIYIGDLDKAHKEMIKEIVKSFSKGD